MTRFHSLAAWSKCLLLAAVGLLVAGLSEPALAQNMMNAPGGASVWTVYAFGNAQAVSDTFRALANFTSSSTFQSIVTLIAICGVLAVGLTSGFSSAVAKNLIGYIVAVFLVCYIFFGVGSSGPLVVRVEVYDTVDGTWKAPVTVPAVVGVPASLISNAGMEITRQIEASFPIPDEMKLTNGAPFNLAAALINDATKARIIDPNISSSFAYYVQDCFTVAVAQGRLSASTLLTSTNFLNDVNTGLKSVYVNTLLGEPVGTPKVVPCSTSTVDGVTTDGAWERLNAAVNAQGSGAADYLQSASAWASTPALSVVNSAADSVAQWATNNGVTNGAAMIKQAAVLSTFTGSFRQAAAATGNSDFLTGIAVEQAHQTQVAGWVVGAEVFNRVMGYVFAILQVFIYGITPLILAVALVPGLGIALIKNFGQILLWLAIWQPMLGIVNFIVLSMQQADLGGALNAGMGQKGFALTNMGVISEKTSNMRAAAVFVGTMVPALAWAMVKGSVDFSRIIGAASGEKFAAGAANTMATGNYSLNQASMDSFTANKHSLGATGDWNHGITSSGGIINKTTDTGGHRLVASGKELGPSASVGRNESDGTTDTTVAGTQEGLGRALSNMLGTSNGQSYSIVDRAGNAVASISNNGLTLTGVAGGGLTAGVGVGSGKPTLSPAPVSGNPRGNNADGAPDTSPMEVGGQVRRWNANGNASAQIQGMLAAVTGGSTNEQASSAKDFSLNQTGARTGNTSDGTTDTTNLTQGRNAAALLSEQSTRGIAVATRMPFADAQELRGAAFGPPASSIMAHRFEEARPATGLVQELRNAQLPGKLEGDADARRAATNAQREKFGAELGAERDKAAEARKAEELKADGAKAIYEKEKPKADAAAEVTASQHVAKKFADAPFVPEWAGNAAKDLSDKWAGVAPRENPAETPTGEKETAPVAPKNAAEPAQPQATQPQPPRGATEGPTTMSFDRLIPGRQGRAPDGGERNPERREDGPRDPQGPQGAPVNQEVAAKPDGAAQPQNSQAAGANGKPDTGPDGKPEERTQDRDAPGNAILAAQAIQPPPPPQQPAPAAQPASQPQQPPAPPPPPPVAEPAPPPQPQQPLPFERDPNANGNAAQMETRANLAEQQATQLQNQMRNANGILDSAEGRPAEELPNVIHEAQDNLRPR